jgi:hypothetical protein
MTIKNVLNQMARMVAGECRWIGNEGIHVYAFGSHVDGKYNPRSLVYRVVTGRRPYDSQPWLDSLTAANIVISEAKA